MHMGLNLGRYLISELVANLYTDRFKLDFGSIFCVRVILNSIVVSAPAQLPTDARIELQISMIYFRLLRIKWNGCDLHSHFALTNYQV